MSDNPFGCPEGVWFLMRVNPTPLLRAVKKLGPKRARFLDGKTPSGGGAPLGTTAWALDGKRATENALLRAAGLDLWGRS